MSICIIPARGGSKRIPRKNVRLFCQRPMIAWSIRAAVDSDCFERIVVTTDDEEVARVAEVSGAEVPFMRASELADDYTPTAPVVADAVRRLKLSSQTPVCCLYATAPFVESADLQYGLEQLEETKASFVLSVTTFASPIQRALRRDASGRIEMLDPSKMLTRSQDLEQAWHDAGQFYWGYAKSWERELALLGAGAQGVYVPRYRVQDIDTEEDWQRAELTMRALYSAKSQ